MARNHARVYTSIWGDQDFTALSAGAQRMFLFLVSQPDLEHSGVIALRERRWSRAAAGITAADVEKDLRDLETARFVVIDFDTEELLVRSLMRWDGVWKQPNVAKAAANQIRTVSSDALRLALREELGRLFDEDIHRDTTRLRDDLVVDLGGACDISSASPSGTPSLTPSGTPSATPSDTPSLGGMGRGNTYVSDNGGSPSPSPIPNPHPKTSAGKPPRDDVERLCIHLADCIESNGSLRPSITQKWREAARLMLDRDGRTEEQIHSAIKWCQDDGFWKAHIMSMPTLREKYDRLRLQASRSSQNGNGGGPRQSTTDQRVAQAQALKAQLRGTA